MRRQRFLSRGSFYFGNPAQFHDIRLTKGIIGGKIEEILYKINKKGNSKLMGFDSTIIFMGGDEYEK